MMFATVGCGEPVATATAERPALDNTALIGSESSSFSSGIQISSAADDRVTIEVGVVFADQESYLCLPLERLGIEKYSSIKGVESSCACVEATIVHYSDPIDDSLPALLLRFRKESAVQETTSDKLNQGHEVQGKLVSALNSSTVTPVNLGVDVTIDLKGGRKVHCTVNFLHTAIKD